MVAVSSSVELSVADKRARAAALRADGGLGELAAEVQPVTLAAEQVLPLPSPLDELVPERGLRRGSVLGVEGPAATSMALAVAAELTATGSWVATVGVPSMGLLAAAELGVDLARCLVVTIDDGRHWAEAVAALIGAVDLVVTRPPAGVRQREVRRVAARARERGTVVLRLPGGDPASLSPDRRFRTSTPTWVGLTPGRGRLVARRVRIDRGEGAGAGGRRAVEVWLPGPEGRLAPVVDEAESAPAPLRSVS
ncbi:MAG: hypothetical protein AAGA99_04835 [Actinomycetota bacterium]